ncbi:MAG: DUF7507 domain-containing protein [Ardenticatenaceae bacterium]
MKRISLPLALLVTLLLLLLVTVPLAYAQDNPEITLEKTVGVDPSGCATTDEITIPAGTEVTYCYRATNTGDITLTNHTLVDSELGVILAGAEIPLAPGEDVFVLRSVVINEPTVNTATWTASAAYVPPVSDDDTATVNIEPTTAVTISTLTTSSAAPPWSVALAGLLVSGTAGILLWRRRR